MSEQQTFYKKEKEIMQVTSIGKMSGVQSFKIENDKGFIYDLITKLQKNALVPVFTIREIQPNLYQIKLYLKPSMYKKESVLRELDYQATYCPDIDNMGMLFCSGYESYGTREAFKSLITQTNSRFGDSEKLSIGFTLDELSLLFPGFRIL